MVLHTCRLTEIQSHIPENANLQCRVLTGSRFTIHDSLPLLSGLIVPIEIPSAELLTESGYIEGKSYFSDQTHLAPGVINTRVKNKYVNIINNSNQEVILAKNQVIATCESYKDSGESGKQGCIRRIKKKKLSIPEGDIPEHEKDLIDKLNALKKRWENCFNLFTD